MARCTTPVAALTTASAMLVIPPINPLISAAPTSARLNPEMNVLISFSFPSTQP